MFDYLLIIIGISSCLFPIAYAHIKKLNSKLVFCCTCYGASLIFNLLCFIAFSPLIVLNTFIFPQIDAAGLATYLNGYFVISNFLISYVELLLPIILFILPSLIMKGYGNIFNAKNT